jgi:putative DNA primase/helicase
MRPHEIVVQALDDGVTLTLGESGEIEVRGTRTDRARWIPVVREAKEPIVRLLRRQRDQERSSPAPATRSGPRPGVANLREQFRDAIIAAGLTPPDHIDADGKVHRFASNGKRGNKAGWYFLHLDGIPAGRFGCWRSGISRDWRADIGRKLSLAEVAEVTHRRRERKADEAERHDEAANMAAEIWQFAALASDDHPYLALKAVRAHGLRQMDGCLVVPLRDSDGRLQSLQSIGAYGAKRFLAGGRVTGGYHLIGKPHGALYVAEGYATGASIHQVAGVAVAVAFNAGNIQPVARALRAKHPELQITNCADDDYRTAGNPGLTKACEAASSVHGLVAIPDFGPSRPEGATDFNDLMQHRGADAVRRSIAGARPSEEIVMELKRATDREPD